MKNEIKNRKSISKKVDSKMKKTKNKYFYAMHIVRFIVVLYLGLFLILMLKFIDIRIVLVSSICALFWELRNSVAPIKRNK